MERTKGRRRLIGVALLLLSFGLLTSCLDVRTEFRIRRNGVVRADIAYRLSSTAASFGRGFGTDEPWPLPLTEKDFRQRTLTRPGVRIDRYQVRTAKDGIETIQVRLSAGTMDAMAAYLDLHITLDDASSRFVLELPAGSAYTETDELTRDRLGRIIGDSALLFSVRPPGRPISVNAGRIEGRLAVLEISLKDVLEGRSPESWTVEW